MDARDQPYTLRCVAARDDGRLILIGESDAEGQRVTAERLLELNNEFARSCGDDELTRRTRELADTTRLNERARDEIRELRGGRSRIMTATTLTYERRRRPEQTHCAQQGACAPPSTSPTSSSSDTPDWRERYGDLAWERGVEDATPR